jgi:hypothetical protein
MRREPIMRRLNEDKEADALLHAWIRAEGKRRALLYAENQKKRLPEPEPFEKPSVIQELSTLIFGRKPEIKSRWECW